MKPLTRCFLTRLNVRSHDYWNCTSELNPPLINITKWINNTYFSSLCYGLPRLTPIVLKSLPHDSSAFTQGLCFYNNTLYESTGIVGRSSIRALNTTNGSISDYLPIKDVFAEGIAIYNNIIYQLTWTEGKVLVYQTNPLKLIGHYSLNGEGWGLTAFEDGLVMSNGSSLLQWFDHEFQKKQVIKVHRFGFPIRHLNDIVFANHFFFANIWLRHEIIQISRDDGNIVKIIDCRNLIELEAPNDDHAIMNGIAYNPEQDIFYVTGKNWKNIFVIKLPK